MIIKNFVGLVAVLPFFACAIAGGGNQGGPVKWKGLFIEKENRCSLYNKDDYDYSQDVEDLIVDSMGGNVYGPYSGNYFESDTKTDIEHMVATSEAHDSGLCAQPVKVRLEFASDLLNLTLASPKVNRCSSTGKCGLDAGEWLPEKNQCWFANRVVEVKQKYSLSIDVKEYEALKGVLDNCTSTDMVYTPNLASNTNHTHQADALSLYDDNNNGRITCTEARKHGIAPVLRGHIAYKYMSDRDNDGVVCE